MAVKALVHLRFMKSRRNLDRTAGVTKKHSYQNDTAPPVLAKTFSDRTSTLSPFATDRGCLQGREAVQYTCQLQHYSRPSKSSDMPRCDPIAESTEQVDPPGPIGKTLRVDGIRPLVSGSPAAQLPILPGLGRSGGALRGHQLTDWKELRQFARSGGRSRPALRGRARP